MNRHLTPRGEALNGLLRARRCGEHRRRRLEFADRAAGILQDGLQLREDDRGHTILLGAGIGADDREEEEAAVDRAVPPHRRRLPPCTQRAVNCLSTSCTCG